jgi:hypothetical protein
MRPSLARSLTDRLLRYTTNCNGYSLSEKKGILSSWRGAGEVSGSEVSVHVSRRKSVPVLRKARQLTPHHANMCFKSQSRIGGFLKGTPRRRT